MDSLLRKKKCFCRLGVFQEGVPTDFRPTCFQEIPLVPYCTFIINRLNTQCGGRGGGNANPDQYPNPNPYPDPYNYPNLNVIW